MDHQICFKEISALSLLFTEKIDFLLVNQQTIFSVKPGFEELKKSNQNFINKIFGYPWNFDGLDATNELHTKVCLQTNVPL